MKENFFEYKKTLEQVLHNVNYLYSGDIISSELKTFTENKNSSQASPSFIINVIKDIYDRSFYKLFETSDEIVISKESFLSNGNPIDYILSKINFNPSFLFCSDNSRKLLGLSQNLKNIKSLPSYFYSIYKFIGLNLETFYCPIINEDDGEYVIYATSSPIQSLVWSIQNMDYSILQSDKTNTTWEHKMSYSFYECNFSAIRIVIRNVSRIREVKINEILN